MNYDMISKFQVELKSLLRQGLSNLNSMVIMTWCMNLYELKKIVGTSNFLAQSIKIISHYKKIGYNINVLQQITCLVVNPITVGNFAFLFIARRWVELQTIWRFRLKDLSIDEPEGA